MALLSSGSRHIAIFELVVFPISGKMCKGRLAEHTQAMSADWNDNALADQLGERSGDCLDRQSEMVGNVEAYHRKLDEITASAPPLLMPELPEEERANPLLRTFACKKHHVVLRGGGFVAQVGEKMRAKERGRTKLFLEGSFRHSTKRHSVDCLGTI